MKKTKMYKAFPMLNRFDMRLMYKYNFYKMLMTFDNKNLDYSQVSNLLTDTYTKYSSKNANNISNIYILIRIYEMFTKKFVRRSLILYIIIRHIKGNKLYHKLYLKRNNEYKTFLEKEMKYIIHYALANKNSINDLIYQHFMLL